LALGRFVMRATHEHGWRPTNRSLARQLMKFAQFKDIPTP